jgi:DNA-binding transcriptional regulator LsrR (DeoR family)
VLAIRRGKNDGILQIKLAVEDTAESTLISRLRYRYQISKAEFHPDRYLIAFYLKHNLFVYNN